jgi:hypothetical protein
MSLVVRAFPLAKGRTVSDVEEFASELATGRKEEADNFYRRFGISHESWHVQETPHGPWVIGVSRISNVESAAKAYATSSQEFDKWFQQRVQHLSGVDPTQQPMGPETRQVFGWSDDRLANSNLCA